MIVLTALAAAAGIASSFVGNAYLWSLVYAQDMFTAFRKGELENPAVGLRYRRTILAPARTYSPDVEVKNFLGRPMSPAAFYAGFTRHP